MITKKQVVQGMELKMALSPVQALRSSMDVRPPTGASAIPRFSEAYRSYRKKVVSEGRLTQWRGVTSGVERERRGIRRAKQRKDGGIW